MGHEIERKFLVKQFSLNDFDIKKKVRIEQTYIVTGKEQMRVRKNDHGGKISFEFTYKKKLTDLKRKEIEFSISEKTYLSLIEKRKPLIKTRYKAVRDGVLFDIDVYENKALKPLIVAEVEFESVEEAMKFEKPMWCSKEISNDKQFGNPTLWKRVQ